MLLATFCLRLACGMAASLLLLSPSQVNPRFYRVHFLTVLGLVAVAAVSVALGGAMALAFLGSLAWSLQGAPGGRSLVAATTVALAAVLVQLGAAASADEGRAARVAGEATSAAVLGTAITAMLMGHSYLIAPSMSLRPLLRLLAALAGAVLLRMAVAAFGLWSWTAGHSLGMLDDVTMWLPLRWGLGLLGPLVLAWMAWQAAKIRSTQSATGILYVVVIFCFLGEMTSQLLLSTTGYAL
jgi:hypothetical protein